MKQPVHDGEIGKAQLARRQPRIPPIDAYDALQGGVLQIRVQDALGALRSPWYDRECREAIHPHEIPQELDINYSVNASTFLGQVLTQSPQALQRFFSMVTLETLAIILLQGNTE